MDKLIQPEQLENLLVAKWANFVDARRLIAFIMACVRDATLPHCIEEEVPAKGVQISISRFEWTQPGFLIWADFSIPTGEGEVAVGTTEFLITPAGITEHIKTIGTKFIQKR
jgi:hypothetical protein